MAINAPTPSCQARVGSEKNAHGAAMSVQMTASHKDSTAMAPTSIHSRPGRIIRSETAMISGQKR